MSKITTKYIKFGTGTNEVNSRSIPANYTPSNYTPAQIDAEGNDKLSAHLKGIDAELISSGGGSAGDIAEDSFSLSNNQSSEANVTDFVFANATVRSFEALVSVEIDATAPLFEVFTLRGIQKTSNWDLSISSTGDSSLVNFSITTSGQIQYTSGNYAGFNSGSIKFRAITTTV